MSVTSAAKQYIPTTSPAWVSRFAKIGLFSKGIVYCLLGILSAMAAFGLGGQKSDKQQTVKFIYDQPFGQVLLILLSLGLLCYTAWRLIQAIKDTEHKGKDGKAFFARARYAFSGLVYAGLAFYAMKIVLHASSGKDGNSRQHLVAKLLDQPFGQWLVGIAAIGFFAAGIYQFYKAFSGNLKKKLDYHGLTDLQQNSLNRAGTFGYASRGIVWLILGYFLLRSALHQNPSEAQGTKQVFDFLQNTGGALLMGIVALGLLSYGIFMFVRAKYEHVNIN